MMGIEENVTDQNSLFFDHDGKQYAIKWSEEEGSLHQAKILVKVDQNQWAWYDGINFVSDWKNDIALTGGRNIIRRINDRLHVIFGRAPDAHHEDAPEDLADVVAHLRKVTTQTDHNGCICIDFIE